MGVYIIVIGKSAFYLLTMKGKYGRINANWIAVSVTDGKCGLPRGNRIPWSPLAPFADRLGTLISYDEISAPFFIFTMEEKKNDQEKSRNSYGQ